MINNIQDLRQEVRGKFRDYLDIKGIQINTKGFFRCLNPDHPDYHPSAHIVPTKDGFHCMSCGFTGDIFTAAHVIDSKPLRGYEFVTESLYYLADLLGIEYDKEAMVTDEMREMFGYYNVIGATANILKNTGDSSAAMDRGWTAETCKELGIGSVIPSTLALRIVRDTGVESDELYAPVRGKYSLIGTGLFGEDLLTFTMFNSRGEAVGFQARDLKWHKPVHAEGGQLVEYPGPKYKNSPESPVYRKREILNGLHYAAQDNARELYLFEGTGSWVTAFQAGLRNSATTCGTALTPEMLTNAGKVGIKTLHWCPDADGPGRNAVMKAIENHYNVLRLFRVFIVDLAAGEQAGENDADWYIRKFGVEAFHGLKKVPLFEWYIDQLSTSEPQDLALKAIPLIAEDPNPVMWHGMINTLAEKTGIDPALIKIQVERHVNGAQAEANRQRDIIVEEMTWSIKREGNHLANLETATRKIESLDGPRSMEHELSIVADRAIEIFTKFESVEEFEDSWKTGWRYLDTMFEGGFPREDGYIVFGGLPQMGKSGWFINGGIKMLSHPDNEDLCFYLMTIDDSMQQVLPKMIACLSGGELTINESRRPRKLSRIKRDIYEQWKGVILDWMAEKRLVITDHKNGDSLIYAKQMIRDLRHMAPDRKIVFALDNFHKLSDDYSDRRHKFADASSDLQALKTEYGILVMVTAELNKEAYGQAGNARRPLLRDLSETGQIAYDANAILLAFNEMEAFGRAREDKVKLYHLGVANGQTKRMPILELDVAKNKLTSGKGVLYYRFNPDCCLMEECTRAQAYGHDRN